MSEESNRIKQMAERNERYYRDFGSELLKAMDQFYGTNYVALPKASWFVRMKVRFKNFWGRLRKRQPIQELPGPPTA